ncbi:IclR family transcriptional regulator [Millisia brevis]|uniref:IclR family transcriptional regulator n=1 Tax=Millisia brevis TaxID=264148 RepID=UPI000AFB8065|nr:helix-turn-helix domain-containing protein [Millisia brevis]
MADTDDLPAGVRPVRTGSQAIERAVSVLYALDGEDRFLSITEVARRADLPVSTTHRIAQALVRGRLLMKDPESEGYGIGEGLLTLANSVRIPVDVDSAAPHLHGLSSRIGMTASLSVAEKRQSVTVYMARPPVTFCHNQIPQQRADLRSTAMGNALVAFTGRRERRDGQPADIETTRRRGYAITSHDDVTAIAVPVFDRYGHVRASIGVQARSVRLNSALIAQVFPVMRTTAALLVDAVDPPRVDAAVDGILRGAI